jgi:hypothetical protein
LEHDTDVTRFALLGALALAAATSAPEAAQPEEARLRLLRRAAVVWLDVEAGGPAVLLSPLLLDDPEHPTDAARVDLASRAGLPVSSPLTAADRAQVDALLAGMPAVLAEFVRRATLVPGTYRYEDRMPSDPSQPRAERAEPETLAFTAEHRKLLKALRWEGMSTNPKRPYGDRASFELDVAGLLGERVPGDAQGQPLFTQAQRARYERLHRETQPALQVFLENARLP